MATPVFRFVEGELFADRYRLVRPIKEGGMGAVYEVVDVRSERRRALKVLLSDLLEDADLRARFEREAKVTAAVESEHLVEVFDAGVDGATRCPFLVMELLRGDDLDGVLETRGALPAREIVTLLRQVAGALDKTHEAGIVHRDLKPENLFLTTREDGSPRMRILDFGIAKVVVKSASGPTRTMGTPMYMAPEQAQGGDIGPAVDLYALAHIAYTMLVGRCYWANEAATMEAIPFLMRIARGGDEPLTVRAARAGRALPKELDVWFVKATAADPDERYGTASGLVEALAVGLTSVRDDEPMATRSKETASPARAASHVVIDTDPGGSVGALSNTRPITLPKKRAPWIVPLGIGFAACAALAVVAVTRDGGKTTASTAGATASAAEATAIAPGTASSAPATSVAPMVLPASSSQAEASSVAPTAAPSASTTAPPPSTTAPRAHTRAVPAAATPTPSKGEGLL